MTTCVHVCMVMVAHKHNNIIVNMEKGSERTRRRRWDVWKDYSAYEVEEDGVGEPTTQKNIKTMLNTKKNK